MNKVYIEIFSISNIRNLYDIQKQVLIIFILSLFYTSTYSQPQITFNRLYNLDTININYLNTNAHSILSINNYYLTQNHINNYLTNTSIIQFLKLDSLGNIIKKTSIAKDSCGFGSGLG